MLRAALWPFRNLMCLSVGKTVPHCKLYKNVFQMKTIEEIIGKYDL